MRLSFEIQIHTNKMEDIEMETKKPNEEDQEIFPESESGLVDIDLSVLEFTKEELNQFPL